MGKAHVHAQRGHATQARATWEEVQGVFDAISPGDTISDFTYPYWRLCVVGSLLFSRLGDPSAQTWQDAVDTHRPASMIRFGAHVELHRGLVMAKDGDHAGGATYAQAALDRLPENKISQSLVLMMKEIRAVPSNPVP